MSVVALSWAKRQRAGGVAAKAVLLVLADYADEEGTCWPSQARIAAECELTDRSVRDQLTKLEAAGLITRSTKRRPDGTQDNSRFRLALDRRNEVPADRNVVPVSRKELPADDSRNVLPDPAERPSETGGTTFQVTTIEPSADPPTPVAEAPGERATPQQRAMAAVLGEVLEAKGVTPKRRSPREEVPEGWTPTDKQRRRAIEHGVDPEEVDHEALKFRSFHRAKGNLFASVDQAWTTWLCNHRQFRPASPRLVHDRAPSSGTAYDRRQRNLERGLAAPALSFGDP